MTDQTAYAGAVPATTGTQGVRMFAWIMTSATFVYLLNNGLMFWGGMPGPRSVLGGEFSAIGVAQLLFYFIAIGLSIAYVQRSRELPLRADSLRLSAG